MARCVKRTAKGPMKVDGKNGDILLCMCGLSKNHPFCDGSHIKTQDEEEGKNYCYCNGEARKECTCACCR